MNSFDDSASLAGVTPLAPRLRPGVAGRRDGAAAGVMPVPVRRSEPGARAVSGGPFRLMIVTETFPPEVNGVARTLHRLVRELVDRGHSIRIVRPRQGAADTPRIEPSFAETLVAGVPLPFYPEVRAGMPAFGRLDRAIAEFAPQALHVATEGPLGWAAVSAARRHRLAVTTDFRTNFHLYGAAYATRLATPVVMSYLRCFHNRADATLVPTRALERTLADEGFDRLAVLGRGVDARAFAPHFRSARLRGSWGAGPDDPVVLHVGRLAREKNLRLAGHAFEAIKQAVPRARLVVAGDGPLRPDLEAAWPSAQFLGWRHGTALAAVYASSDLLLFPSLTETFGNVTMEGLASGLPVVAFDYGAAREHIRHAASGWLAPFGDAEAFVTGAVRLACDRALARSLGRGGREVALAQSWDRVASGFEKRVRAALEHTRA